MIHDFGREVARRINAEIALKESQMANGACASFDEYKNMCGQIRGLRLALEHLEATLENYEKDDD